MNNSPSPQPFSAETQQKMRAKACAYLNMLPIGDLLILVATHHKLRHDRETVETRRRGAALHAQKVMQLEDEHLKLDDASLQLTLHVIKKASRKAE